MGQCAGDLVGIGLWAADMVIGIIVAATGTGRSVGIALSGGGIVALPVSVSVVVGGAAVVVVGELTIVQSSKNLMDDWNK